MCILLFIMQRSQYSWWKVKLANEAKIYMIQVTTSPIEVKNIKALVSVDSHEDGSSPNCMKEIYIANLHIPVICEPPLPSRYVKIETRNERLELCEVQVYGAGNEII